MIIGLYIVVNFLVFLRILVVNWYVVLVNCKLFLGLKNVFFFFLNSDMLKCILLLFILNNGFGINVVCKLCLCVIVLIISLNVWILLYVVMVFVYLKLILCWFGVILWWFVLILKFIFFNFKMMLWW